MREAARVESRTTPHLKYEILFEETPLGNRACEISSVWSRNRCSRQNAYSQAQSSKRCLASRSTAFLLRLHAPSSMLHLVLLKTSSVLHERGPAVITKLSL